MRWEWVAAGLAGSQQLPAAESKTEKRELGILCNSLLELNEDALVTAIREGTSEVGGPPFAACQLVSDDHEASRRCMPANC